MIMGIVYACEYTYQDCEYIIRTMNTEYAQLSSWLYTLLVSWYLVLAVHFVGILVRFPGCELGCKSTYCLSGIVISSFLSFLEATSVIMKHLK